jgi:hypothetical protein
MKHYIFLRMRLWLLAGLTVLAMPSFGRAQTPYQRPPGNVLDILDAPVTPDVSISPARDRLLLIEQQRYPSINELAQPMLALAGIRINPQNRGPHRLRRTWASRCRPCRAASRWR